MEIKYYLLALFMALVVLYAYISYRKWIILKDHHRKIKEIIDSFENKKNEYFILLSNISNVL